MLKMAAVLTPPSSALYRESEGMNTIPDPRTPSPATPISRNTSNASDHHPELNNEIAALSTKLINAINHQTNLDDSLQATRIELEVARARLAHLEAAAKTHEEQILKGLLVRAEDVNRREAQWKRELDDERRLRITAEKAKRSMEQELENLTTALFEEANTMVASARKETEASERKSDHYKQQLRDAELLLASHQEQLQDLKSVMEKLSSERDEEEANTYPSTVSSTPGAVNDKMSRLLDATITLSGTPGEDVTPDHPLRFSHLIRPILRTDNDAFRDFSNVLTACRTAPQSRATSGSFTGLALSTLTGGQAHPVNQSSPPVTQLGAVPAGTASPVKDPLPQLKDTKMYKRALAEDIEPTLRLDIAPGLSWLARRTVLNAMANNTLVIEPLPPPKHQFYGPIFACALCGEHRKKDQYRRKHQFRTSDAEDAQRYPLCEFCLGRVRASCDYIGFLRLVRDGLWRAEGDEEIRAAWEEAVRLRERMFWARLGGGVIPVLAKPDIPKSPVSLGRARRQGSVDSTASKPLGEDPFVGEKDVSVDTAAATAEIDGKTEEQIAEEANEQLRQDVRRSLGHIVPKPEVIETKHQKEAEEEEVKPETEPASRVEPQGEAVAAATSEGVAQGLRISGLDAPKIPIAETPDSASAFATPKEEKAELEFTSSDVIHTHQPNV